MKKAFIEFSQGWDLKCHLLLYNFRFTLECGTKKREEILPTFRLKTIIIVCVVYHLH
ncbi:hypothetical protein [Paenibacillus sp. NRS-1781]|uniref:hypothetical protein n=1 Tax=Paenibacillus sp. NRS-1781 TaxID=3233905 RepID=UPI003D2D94ED